MLPISRFRVESAFRAINTGASKRALVLIEAGAIIETKENVDNPGLVMITMGDGT